MSVLLTRTRLLDTLRASPPPTAVIAPAGWGKSALLETAAQSDLRVVPIALGNTEGHPSLFIEALAQGLKRAYPGTAVGAVRAIAALRSEEAPDVVLERTREALGVSELTLGFDEVERLPRGPVFELVRRLVAARPATLKLIFTSRQPLPPELGVGEPASVIGARELALTADEIEALHPDRALGRAVLRETGGWPALVVARLRASSAVVVPFPTLVPALGPIVDEAIAHIKSEARFVLQVASIVGRFTKSLMVAIVSGDVIGSPEARRRLMRLEAPVIARALDELQRSCLIDLVDPKEERYECLVGLQGVLRERFAAKDHAGWLEAHRRAAELRLAALGKGEAGQVGPDLIDLFAASGERERLIEMLGKHGSRLELELAASDQDGRILAWVDALGSGPTPFWAEVLAGLALARRGDAEQARERLGVARDKLASERKETGLWRWQARLAEAQALSAQAKNDSTEARSWLLRGLDQIAQTKKRGLAGGSEAPEADALELRMSIALARLCRASTGWDKLREASLQALAALGPVAADEARALELRRILVAGAFAAGDVASLEAEARGEDGIARVAKIAADLLRDGEPNKAIERLRALATASSEPLTQLVLARLLEPGRERERCLDLAAAAADPWIALEAEIRRSKAQPPGSPALEGYSAALLAEAQAPGPSRGLELARDAYRRVGARWDEARLWLVLGAAAARRVDDGDGDSEAVLRPVDGAVEAGQAMGFAVPWSIAGRGESDPERRVRTLLLAGLRGGQDKTKAACRAELERIGIDTRAVAATAERPKAGVPTPRRSVAIGGAPFVVTSRSGTQGITAADYQQILGSKNAASFVVCVPDQLVLNFGKQLALAQKRVMMPLLLHILRHPDDSFSMLELARDIWDSPELTPTVQTKVKVAVSRLRALLGKSRNYIITTRKMEGGESVVAYQAAPQLQFQIVEAAPRD